MMSKILTNEDTFNLIKLKTWWEKEKLLVTSNFSFSHHVLKSGLLFMCQNEYLWSKGLTLSQLTNFKLSETFKMKEFADNKFKFDENGRKLSKPIEKKGGMRKNYLL